MNKKKNVVINQEFFDDEVETNEDILNEKFNAKDAEELEKEITDEINHEKSLDDEENDDGSVLEDSIKMFRKEINRYPLLTAEQEKALVKRANSKNANESKLAKERLFLCNLRLVFYVAKKYKDLGVPFEDLVSEGNIGLFKGIEKFNYKYGTKLSTFVVWWIRQAVARALADQGRSIRLPVHINDKLNKYRKIVKEYTDRYGKEPTIEYVAKKLKTSPKCLDEILMASCDVMSLDKTIGDDEDTTIGELVADENFITPEANVEKIYVKDELKKALNTLKDRERKVIELRYGIIDDKARTLEEVGNILNITRERVRQIEEHTIKKLKYRVGHLENMVA